MSRGSALAWHLGTIAILTFFAVVVAWNVTDILNVGVNFWNVFWLALVLLLTFGGTQAVRIIEYDFDE